MSDWGAVNDRVEALKAGLELEMPSSNGINNAQLSFILIIGGETYDNQGITVHTTR